MCSDLTFCQCFFSKETREFSCRMDILDAIVLSHSHVADTNRQAEHLLYLKLDGGLQVKDLDVEVVRDTSEGNFPC